MPPPGITPPDVILTVVTYGIVAGRMASACNGRGGDSVVGLSGGAVLWSGDGRYWLDLSGPFAAMTIDLKGGAISQGCRVIEFAPVVGVRGFAYRRIGNQAAVAVAVVCGGEDRAGRLDGSLMNDLLQAGSGDDLATTWCRPGANTLSVRDAVAVLPGEAGNDRLTDNICQGGSTLDGGVGDDPLVIPSTTGLRLDVAALGRMVSRLICLVPALARQIAVGQGLTQVPATTGFPRLAGWAKTPQSSARGTMPSVRRGRMRPDRRLRCCHPHLR